MSVDEVLYHIREDLYVDAYAEQEKYMFPFKFRHGVRDVTRYYDTCPHCGGLDTLTATEECVKCSCGWQLTLDKYGFFHEPDGKIHTAADWEEIQLANYHARFERGDFPSEGDIEIFEIGENFSQTPLPGGQLKSTAEGLEIGGLTLPFREMTPPEILSGGRKLELTCGKTSYMLHKEGACLNKYVELYKWAEGAQSEQ